MENMSFADIMISILKMMLSHLKDKKTIYNKLEINKEYIINSRDVFDEEIFKAVNDDIYNKQSALYEDIRNLFLILYNLSITNYTANHIIVSKLFKYSIKAEDLENAYDMDDTLQVISLIVNKFLSNSDEINDEFIKEIIYKIENKFIEDLEEHTV